MNIVHSGLSRLITLWFLDVAFYLKSDPEQSNVMLMFAKCQYQLISIS